MTRVRMFCGVTLVVSVLGGATTVIAQSPAGHGAPSKDTAKPPRVISMDELHWSGGVPRGWKFTLPSGGDPAKGRQLFAELECYKCHAIQGAGFPPSGGDGKTGPALTGMGAHHPAEYFAESIIAPNNVLISGPGWIGPDGQSTMPSYAASLTVAQLLDLVAFIKSQDQSDHGGGHAHQTIVAQERAAGPYHVRIAFRAADGMSAGHEHGAGAHHAEHTRSSAGHLMVFVSDETTGEAVPYLPVSVAIHARGTPARVVKLAPMLDREGFHYGADATLPPATQKVVLTIGVPAMQVAGPERGRFARGQTVSFEWSVPAK